MRAESILDAAAAERMNVAIRRLPSFFAPWPNLQCVDQPELRALPIALTLLLPSTYCLPLEYTRHLTVARATLIP